MKKLNSLTNRASRQTNPRCIAVISVAFLFAVVSALHADVIFYDDFNPTGTGDDTLSERGWGETTAWDAISTFQGREATHPTAAAFDSSTSPQYLLPDSVMTFGTADGEYKRVQMSFLFALESNMVNQGNKFGIGLQVREGDERGFYAYFLSPDGVDTANMLMLKDGTPPVTATISESEPLSLVADTWYEVTMDIGLTRATYTLKNFSTQATIATISGTYGSIQGVHYDYLGMYSRNADPYPTYRVYIDDLELIEIPEPASAAVLLLGTATLLNRRRRRGWN